MLTKKEKSIVLVQGNPKEGFCKTLRKRDIKEVFILEGRPKTDSSRFKNFLKHKITPTLISDNMAGFLFYKNLVKEIWIAYFEADAERALCNMGSTILGVLGKRHMVPVNLFPSNGTKMKSANKDILYFQGKRIAPKGIKGYVPLTEWLSKEYITQIMK